MARIRLQKLLISQYAEDDTITDLTTTFTNKVSLTVAESGEYLIDGYVEITSKSTAYSHEVQLLRNAGVINFDIRECQDTTDFFAVRLMKRLSLTAGDLLRLQVRAETAVTGGCRRGRLHLLKWL